MELSRFVCLLNNILEIRVDAINFIVSCRRPLPVRVPGIEIWNDFLNIISKTAIICNAAIISFTSDIIPRLYFKYAIADDSESSSTYVGFHTFVLSRIPTTHWGEEAVVHDSSSDTQTTHGHDGGETESGTAPPRSHHPDECYYRGFRQPEYPYDLRADWWQVTCLRLATFSLFVLLGFSFQFLYGFIVPDVPKTVQLQIQRRRYVINTTLEKDNLANVAAVEQEAATLAKYQRETESAQKGQRRLEEPRTSYDSGGGSAGERARMYPAPDDTIADSGPMIDSG